jgi:hypothetical protein
MNEASRVVAQTRVSRITRGKLKVEDLDSETAMALTLFGIWECAEVAYDDVLLLSKSLGIALVGKAAGYHVRDREIGINPSNGGQTRRGDSRFFFAPLVRSRSKLRLALPEERQPARLQATQTDWDRLHGVLMAYREGDIPVARAYLERQVKECTDHIWALLHVWAAEARDPRPPARGAGAALRAWAVTGAGMGGLASLQDKAWRPWYRSTQCNLLHDFYIPALTAAKRYGRAPGISVPPRSPSRPRASPR